MADNFCSQCGNRLSGAGRFCTECGTPVGGDRGIQSASGIRDVDFYKRLGVKVGATGGVAKTAEETQCIGMYARDLNQLVMSSIMNAPLDTNFLLVQNPARNWTKWVPVVCLDDISALKPLARASVFYYMESEGSKYWNENKRGAVASAAWEAFHELDSALKIRIEIHFKLRPSNFGNLEPSIRNRWIPYLVSETGIYSASTSIPFPLTGTRMKERLAQYASWLNALFQQAADEKTKKGLSEAIDYARWLAGRMPDGFPAGILCLGLAILKGSPIHLVPADESQASKKAISPGGMKSGFAKPGSQEIPLSKVDLKQMTTPQVAPDAFKMVTISSRQP